MQQPLPVGVQGGGGGAERDQGRQRLEPGPPSPLLLAPDEQGLEPAPAADHQRAGAGRPPILWALRLTRSAPSASRSSGTCPHGGGGVDVHRNIGGAAQRHDVAHRLQRSHFVVGPLAVHQRGPRQRGGRQARRRGLRSSMRAEASTGMISVGASRAEVSRTAECSTSA